MPPLSFIGLFTHELRNLLAPMRNGVQMLRFRETADPVVKAAADIIDRQIENIVKLVDTAADAEQIQRGTVSLTRQNVDLNRIVEDALAAQQGAIDHGRVQLDVTLPQTPFSIDGDARRLTQALGNLIEYAALGVREGGTVTVEGTATPNEVQLRISNDAVVASELLPELLSFDTAASPRARSAGGLDVGPAVARALVELHRGRVTVTSNDSGTEFIVILPRALAAAQETAAPETPAGAGAPQAQSAPGAGPRRRILIADDSAAVRTSLAGVLTEMGHDVEAASNGAEAVEMALRSKPEFVLLDVYMPGLNGINAARQIRARFPSSAMRLVMMSGNTLDATTVRVAQEAGFDHCVDKVFDFDSLKQLLAS